MKKTKHHRQRKLQIILVLILVILIIVAIFIYFWKNPFWSNRNTSATDQKDDFSVEFDIEQYHSSLDMDNDGVDDQMDILQSAKEYVDTKPKYKSKYYEGGYPDDGYGVCTDVVAFAFLNSGYDLQKLVNEDIQINLEEYGIDEPDSNIDFRRVQNLKVYFSHTAQELTPDISEIEEWQGGDIVIFSKHIGIISDKRNEDGIPYVIHHVSETQKYYEEDILEKRAGRDDICGHYRILDR